MAKEEKAKEEKKAPELPKFVFGESKYEIEFGTDVIVTVSDEAGRVDGIAFDEIDGLRWTYRVGAGWYTLDQLTVK